MNLQNFFESANNHNFNPGDPVIITGNVQFRGKTGDVREIGRNGDFIVVDLYNYGPQSFHVSDISFNDYANSDDEQERNQGVAEGSEQRWRVTVGNKSGTLSHVKTFTGTKEQAIKQAVTRFATSKNPVVTAELVKQDVAAEREKAEKYKAHLLKTAPRIMDFLAKTVKGWRPSKQEMLGAIDTAYTIMKHTGDVKQAGKAMMDELNTLHRRSRGGQRMAEGLNEFAPGNFDGGDDETPGSWDNFIKAFDPEIRRMGFGMDKRSSHDARIYAHPEAQKGIMVRQHPEKDNVYYKLFQFFNKGEDEVGLADLSQNGAASVLVKVEDFLNGQQGVAEGSEDKIKQLKQDYATAVHWSKNETSPQKREAARQKAEKIKAHLEKQYKQGVAEGSLNEFAPKQGRGDAGNYFQALASAWYNGAFDTGSLQKGIKSKEDVERLLQRGIVCPDGVTRKFGIDYNAEFDGVVISSDDYYEHSDHGKKPGTMIDVRTGKPWGPYDYMEFSDNDLSEDVKQGMAEGIADLKNIDPGELAGSTLGGIAGYMAGDAVGGPMVGFGAAGVGSAIGGALAKEGMLDNPGQEDSPVAQAIIRRILLQRTDLLAKHGPDQVGQAVDDVADFVGDVDEIGSSDVSGWVNMVQEILISMDQGVEEGILGSDPNRGQKIPNWAKRGVVGKIGRKLDPAWSDVQRTVPQHLVSKQSSVPATNAPATKEMPKATSVIPARAIPQSAVTKPSQSVKKNVVKTIADKQGVEETSISAQVSLPKWQIGLTVFVKHLGQKGEIASLGNDSAIVDVGMRQYRVPLNGLKRYPSQGVAEGAVKELSMDLKTMSDQEFQRRYKITKAQARANLKTQHEDMSEMRGFRGIGGARSRENDENSKIDAMLAKQNQQLRDYELTGKFWLKQKDTQQHISGEFVGKAAANQAAIELLGKRPELRGNLVITAYGPDEPVAENKTANNDRPWADSTQQLFAESRSAKRVAIREILSSKG
jgi:hypothetical protein